MVNHKNSQSHWNGPFPFFWTRNFSLYMEVISKQTRVGTHHALWHPQRSAKPFWIPLQIPHRECCPKNKICQHALHPKVSKVLSRAMKNRYQTAFDEFCSMQRIHWNMNVKNFQQLYYRPQRKILDNLRISQLYQQWYNGHKPIWNSLSHSIRTSGKTPHIYSHIKARKHESEKHGTWYSWSTNYRYQSSMPMQLTKRMPRASPCIEEFFARGYRPE